MADKKPKKPKLSEHSKDLLLLFSVPIVITVIAVIAVYLPRLFANPQYDFLYTFCDGYDCDNTYITDGNGGITIRKSNADNDSYDYNRSEEKIGLYDVSAGSTRIISYAEARSFYVYENSKSPDGYELERENDGGGFLFWGDYDESLQLKNGLKRKPVDLGLNASRYYYYNDFNFLGWVSN